MIIKEFLEKFLQEDKPVGDKNKEIWLDYLKDKYSDKATTGLFVSFVQVDKIGINPFSTYNTPNGVYTYPMRFLLDGNNVPYRGSKKPNKIKILKAVSKNVLDNNLSKEEYEKCKEKCLKMIEEKCKDNSTFLQRFESYEEYIKLLESDARVKSNFGKLWNITREVSNNPNNWSKILIDLGFDIVYDNGNGIIHNNEPIQAVFLNPKSYKVVDEEYVDTEERYNKLHKTINLDTFKQDVEYLDDTRAYNYLKTNKKQIMQIGENNDYNLTLVMLSIIYNWSSFKKEQKDELLDLYKDLFKKTFKNKHSLKALYRIGDNDKIHFCEHFHEEIAKIIYEFLYEDDYSLVCDVFTESFVKKYFPEVLEKLSKTQEESLEIEELLKSIQESIDDKKFKKIVEKNKKRITKDPNEFFLDLPSTPMKAPKNNTKISFDN